MTTDTITTSTLKPQNRRKDYEERVARLKQYRFPPGNNANPKGRPKAVLTKRERLELLSEIAKHNIESPVSAGHKIAAIRESNLMEGVYETARPAYQDNRTLNIIVMDKETRELTQNAGNRFKVIEGERSQQENKQVVPGD